MSMRTDCVYGYGFDPSCSDHTLNAFIISHKDTLLAAGKKGGQDKEIVAYVKENGPDANIKEDFFDYECDEGGLCGAYAVIANVISAETGIRMSYDRDEDGTGDELIHLTRSMPWGFNEKEKALTEESLQAMLEPYLRELGKLPQQCDYTRVEYFG